MTSLFSNKVEFVVPQGAYAGQVVSIEVNGSMVNVSIPAGVVAGQRVQVQLNASNEQTNILVPTSDFSAHEHFQLEVPADVQPRQYCDRICWKNCCCCFCVYFLAIGIGSVIAAFTGPLGLAVLAFVPAVVVAFILQRWYGKVITACTLTDVFLEAFAILIIPLMLAITFIDMAAPMRSNCGDEAPNAPEWRYVFQAYVRASLLEESLKYFAIRRLLHKDYVVDARSLLCYGAYAGVAFGVLENISYFLAGGIGTAIVRSFLTVPLHSSTAIIIARKLIPFRFKAPLSLADEFRVNNEHFGEDENLFSSANPREEVSPIMNGREGRGGVSQRTDNHDQAETGGGGGGGAPACCSKPWWSEQVITYVSAIWLPVLIHGSYDVFLFVGTGKCGEWGWLQVGAYVIFVALLFYARQCVFDVEQKYPIDETNDVHLKIKNGEVKKPCICCNIGGALCCLCCDCCY